MPLTTAAGSITSQTGNISQILIAEQANYADESQSNAATPRVVASNGALSGGDFYRFQPRINSADIAREGATLEGTFFDGSSAQTQDAPGPVDIANGLSIALSGNGTALPLRMLTQDKNPNWNIYGASGQTIPAAVNVVANTQTLSTAAANATIADNLSSTISPIKLTVTPSSTASLATGQTRATITIVGTDNWDAPLIETLSFTSSTATTAATTRLWFKTVTRVTSAGWDEASGKTYGVSGRDRSVEVIFTPQDDELVAFWTAEVVKGITPNVYYGLCLQSATIEITRDALVAFDCTFLGRRGLLYTNLAGETTQGTEGQADYRNYPAKTDNSGLESASADVFGGWQTTITAENNDIQLAMQEATLTINQELAYTNVLGEQYQVSPPSRDTKRLSQLEATVVYAPENNFSTYFEGNQVLPNVNVRWAQRGLGAYPYELVFEAPECQLTADPDPAVADPGTISQTVTMKAVRSATRAYEYRIRARYSEYDLVRIYS